MGAEPESSDGTDGRMNENKPLIQQKRRAVGLRFGRRRNAGLLRQVKDQGTDAALMDSFWTFDDA